MCKSLPTKSAKKQFLFKKRPVRKIRNLGNLGNLGNFFPRFLNPNFRFWLQGKIENSEIRILGIIFARFLRFSTFPSFRFAIFSFYKKLFFNILKYRNSHLQVLLIIGVLKDFAILTGKNLFWSLFFNKVAERRATTLL